MVYKKFLLGKTKILPVGSERTGVAWRNDERRKALKQVTMKKDTRVCTMKEDTTELFFIVDQISIYL